MPSQGVLGAQSPSAEGEIAHVARSCDWHAVGRARARTSRSHHRLRRAHASAPPDRSRRRRTGMPRLGEPSASDVILSPQLIPDRRWLTTWRLSGRRVLFLLYFEPTCTRIHAAAGRCSRGLGGTNRNLQRPLHRIGNRVSSDAAFPAVTRLDPFSER